MFFCVTGLVVLLALPSVMRKRTPHYKIRYTQDDLGKHREKRERNVCISYGSEHAEVWFFRKRGNLSISKFKIFVTFNNKLNLIS